MEPRIKELVLALHEKEESDSPERAPSCAAAGPSLPIATAQPAQGSLPALRSAAAGAAGAGLVGHSLRYCGPLCAGGPGRGAGLTGAAGRLPGRFLLRPVTLGKRPSDRWAARVVAT